MVDILYCKNIFRCFGPWPWKRSKTVNSRDRVITTRLQTNNWVLSLLMFQTRNYLNGKRIFIWAKPSLMAFILRFQTLSLTLKILLHVWNILVNFQYMEMMIQFAFIALFSPAFPAAAVVCFLNNIAEIRVDAGNILINNRLPSLFWPISINLFSFLILYL